MSAIYTNAGLAAINAAIAKGQSLVIAKVAFSNAQSELTPDLSELLNEVWRGSLSSIEIDPTNPRQSKASVIIPETVGGWWIYQYGLYAADNTLLVIGDLIPAYKAAPGSDSNSYTLEIILRPVNGKSPGYELPADDDNETLLTPAILSAMGIRAAPDGKGLQIRNKQGNWITIMADETTLEQEEVSS